MRYKTNTECEFMLDGTLRKLSPNVVRDLPVEVGGPLVAAGKAKIYRAPRPSRSKAAKKK